MSFFSKLSHFGKTAVKFDVQILIQSVSNLFDIPATQALVVVVERSGKTYGTSAVLPENDIANFSYVIQFASTLYKSSSGYSEKAYNIYVMFADDSKKRLFQAVFDVAEFAANTAADSEITRVILLTPCGDKKSQSLLPSHLLGPQDKRPQMKLTFRIRGFNSDNFSSDTTSQRSGSSHPSERPTDISVMKKEKAPSDHSIVRKDTTTNHSSSPPTPLQHIISICKDPNELLSSFAASSSNDDHNRRPSLCYREHTPQNRDGRRESLKPSIASKDGLLKRSSEISSHEDKPRSVRNSLLEKSALRLESRRPSISAPGSPAASPQAKTPLNATTLSPALARASSISLSRSSITPADSVINRLPRVGSISGAYTFSKPVTAPAVVVHSDDDDDEDADEAFHVRKSSDRDAFVSKLEKAIKEEKNNEPEDEFFECNPNPIMTAAEYDEIVVAGDMPSVPDWLMTPAPGQMKKNIDDLLTKNGQLKGSYALPNALSSETHKFVLPTVSSQGPQASIVYNKRNHKSDTENKVEPTLISHNLPSLPKIAEVASPTVYHSPPPDTYFNSPVKPEDNAVSLPRSECTSPVIPIDLTQNVPKRDKPKKNKVPNLSIVVPGVSNTQPVINVKPLENQEFPKSAESQTLSSNIPSPIVTDDSHVVTRTVSEPIISVAPLVIPEPVIFDQETRIEKSNENCRLSITSIKSSSSAQAYPNNNRKISKSPSEIDVALLLQECVYNSQGFWNNCVPTSACILFRAVVHWKSMRNDRKWILVKIMEALNQRIRKSILDNSLLAFWVTNISLLCHLVSKQHPLVLDKLIDFGDEDNDVLIWFTQQLRNALVNCFQALLQNHYSKLDNLQLRKLLEEEEELDSPTLEFICGILSDAVSILDTQKCFSSLRNQFITCLLSFVTSSLINIIIQNPKFCIITSGVRLKLVASMLQQWCRETLGAYFEPHSLVVFQSLQELCLLLMTDKSILTSLEQLGEICHSLNPRHMERILINWNVANSADDCISNTLLEELVASEPYISSTASKSHLNPYEQSELTVEIKIASFYLFDVNVPQVLSVQPQFRFLNKEDDIKVN